MTSARWVVLGLAPARTPWFTTVAQWANTGAAPIEFLKCLSSDELLVRLRGDQPVSAVLLDGRMPNADRDLVAAIVGAHCIPVVVTEAATETRWVDIGVHVFLREPFDPRDLVDALAAAPRVTHAEVTLADPEPRPARWKARMAAVCGTGGTGASTIAMALAQGLGRDPRNGRLVVLADLARHAEQGLLHDATDVVPGVQELVEAHRLGRLPSDDVRHMTFDVADRGYSLLLGLRRPRDWSAIAPSAFATALSGLAGAFRAVVCDTDGDVEGEAEGGSLDVEDRNTMSRTALAAADVVFVIGLPGVKGLHALVRQMTELTEFGVPAERLQPIVNRAPRSGRIRAEMASALHALLPDALAGAGSVVFVPERPVDACIRDVRALPQSVVAPVGTAWHAALLRSNAGDVELTRDDERPDDDVEPVVPGSLGHWWGEAEEVAG